MFNYAEPTTTADMSRRKSAFDLTLGTAAGMNMSIILGDANNIHLSTYRSQTLYHVKGWILA